MSHGYGRCRKGEPKNDTSNELKAPGSIVKIRIVRILALNEILTDPYVGNHFDASSETVHDQHRAEYFWSKKSRKHDVGSKRNPVAIP